MDHETFEQRRDGVRRCVNDRLIPLEAKVAEDDRRDREGDGRRADPLGKPANVLVGADEHAKIGRL